jgi:PEP-CTERM motif
MKARIVSLVLAAFIVLTVGSFAMASTCDLTASTGTCVITGSTGGDAIFTNNDLQSTGTGVIDPFLRIQNGGTEQGFNEDYNNSNPTLYDEKTGIWTHSEPLSNLIPTDIDGTLYYQFLLDINQTKEDPFLTLTSLLLYDSSTPNPACDTSNAPGSCLGTLVWDLGDNVAVLNYELNPGSGAGDLWVYIPSDLFTAGDNLILFSSFGSDGCPDGVNTDNGHHGNYSCLANDGFEEWTAVAGSSPSVPEPGSLALFGTGALGLAGYLRRKIFS